VEFFNYTENARKFAYRHPFFSYLGIHFLFWTVSYTLYVLVRHFFIESVRSVTEVPLPSNLMAELLQGVVLSGSYSLIVGYISFQFDQKLPSLSFILEIAVRSLSYFAAFLVVWSIGSFYFSQFVVPDLVIPEQAINNQFYALLLYTAVSAVLFGFITQVNKSYGPGVLVPVLLGYYRKPVKEYRIFLFADLNSSTTYAEKLGMQKYSLLIQECFNIANRILPEHDGQIYQYVGDEIVLVWQAYRKEDFYNTLNYYFHFISELKEQEPHFQEIYGVCPEFKAGINCGEITVAEVGSVKRDVAYHGDNINVAARLLALCSDLEEKILVTQGFKNQVSEIDRYEFTFIREVKLKGKVKTTNVYSVQQVTSTAN